MSTVYETGHAKNAANFETLISSVKAFGPTYNPSKTGIHLGDMQLKSQQTNTAIANVHKLFPAYSKAAALREIAFEPIKKLSTKIISALLATDTPKQMIDNAKTNHRKLQGSRATPKLTDQQVKDQAAEGKIVKQISASQLSYDSIIEHLYKQIQLLMSIPQYTPNETELKIVTLTALHTNLKSVNDEVVNQTTALDNARIARNEMMYNKETGMVAIALDSKMYIRSVYGTSSAQYKQISALPFRYVLND